MTGPFPGATHLETRWLNLCRIFPGSTAGEAAEILAALQAQYGEKTRFYHNLDHINHCLQVFDVLSEIAENPLAIELAIWFHDAVYDPKAHDNEERSAAIAGKNLSTLGAHESLIKLVQALIITTHHRAPPQTIDEKIIVDADLAILGETPAMFDRYESQIRTEYAWVPEPEFRTKRGELLTLFLKRDRLFQTETGFRIFEESARKNIRRSLNRPF